MTDPHDRTPTPSSAARFAVLACEEEAAEMSQPAQPAGGKP